MIRLAFQLRAAGYDIGLQGDEITLDFFGDGDPDGAVVKPLIEQVKVNKAALLQYLRHEEMSAAIIGQAIGRARDWDDLSAICDRMDMAVNTGDLGLEQADRLIAVVKTRSQQLPEIAGDQSGIGDEL